MMEDSHEDCRVLNIEPLVDYSDQVVNMAMLQAALQKAIADAVRIPVHLLAGVKPLSR